MPRSRWGSSGRSRPATSAWLITSKACEGKGGCRHETFDAYYGSRQFRADVDSLSAILDKGAAYTKSTKLDLVNARLAPDMFSSRSRCGSPVSTPESCRTPDRQGPVVG